jgi:hypothetical protein
MNTEHVEIVKSGNLNRWRRDNPGKALDLSRAKFTGVDLSGVDLSGVDLSGANLYMANFSRANISGANFSGADCFGANLSKANLSVANFSGADCFGANFSGADCFGADFSGAKLSVANLSGANFSGASLFRVNLISTNLLNVKGLLNPSEWIEENGEQHPEGFVFYKVFGLHYPPNPAWKIQAGSEITEEVNYNRTNNCGSGINIATLGWIKENIPRKIYIWKVLIKAKDLAQVCVPYSTDGKIRAGKITLIKKQEK